MPDHNFDDLNSTSKSTTSSAPPNDTCPKYVSGVYFCFDFGQKRIGLAVGHSDTKTANPLSVIRNINGRPEWHHIDIQVKQWQPVGLIVGLPVYEEFAGNDEKKKVANSLPAKQPPAIQPAGNQQQLVLSAAFSKKLGHRYNIPVYRCDERYSSIEAARLLAENRGRGKRKKVGREDLDKAAAAIILSQWFNFEFQ